MNMERFWKRIDIQSEDDCWNWLGSTVDGYGTVTYKNKVRKAHRVAYELATGNEPQYTIDHLCRNRLCCNPKHLEDVTRGVNTLRGESFSAKFARRTECNHGHPFDEQNTVIDKRGYRACKTCRRLNSEKQRRNKGISERPAKGTPRPTRVKTHCKNGHKFTEENTRKYDNRQYCIICCNERGKLYMQRKRNGQVITDA